MLGTLFADPNLSASAVLSLDRGEFTIQAIDETDGVVVSVDGMGVETIAPAASVRATDLRDLGLAPGDLDGGTLVLNGTDWRIVSVRPRPSPSGEPGGTYRLTLEQITDNQEVV